MQLSTSHWLYAGHSPSASALFKQSTQDFVVTEDLGFEPSGEGEHHLFYIEKENTNTAFVAEQLAKTFKQPLRNVSYAGRKDKYALTRQWFSIYAPKVKHFDINEFSLPSVTITQYTKHHKKIRTGQHKGNHFTITLRDVTDLKAVSESLQYISENGVPNYFGEQRFGVVNTTDSGSLIGGNLALAERMMNGEEIRNRNKRSMAISALRSWLFNEFISERLAQGHYHSVLLGDALNLSKSNSFFVAEEPLDELQHRYEARDIAPTAPLWGDTQSAVSGDALAFESEISQRYAELCDFLASLNMQTARRPIKIWPANLEWTAQGDTLTINFWLPAGCFATSVLRECVNTVTAA